jgi:hypothetical protein
VALPPPAFAGEWPMQAPVLFQSPNKGHGLRRSPLTIGQREATGRLKQTGHSLSICQILALLALLAFIRTHPETPSGRNSAARGWGLPNRVTPSGRDSAAKGCLLLQYLTPMSNWWLMASPIDDSTTVSDYACQRHCSWTPLCAAPRCFYFRAPVSRSKSLPQDPARATSTKLTKARK